MNIVSIFTILLLVGFIVWMIKYLEKKLPERDKRIKCEHDEELQRKAIKEAHVAKQELEVQRVINEEKIKDQSENNKKMYKDNVRKGRDYELFITDYFRKQGYQIKPFGILNGRKDKGIDVIIKKEKEITLIQCKNWKADSSYKIKHKHLKEFIGNTTAFLENNKEKAEGYIIKRMFVTSNDVLDNSARHFLSDNNSILEHKVIPFTHI